MLRTHELLRESVYQQDLASGGRLWFAPQEGRRCHVVLTVAYGALHEAGAECDEPAGIAHFLEHRLFEKATGDITERFTDIGADVDAQTGFVSTSYSVTCGPDVLLPSVALLLELAGEPHFPAASVARERSIVGHEIQLFEDNVEWLAFQTMLQALYPAQRISVDIAGTPESLGRMDADMLQRCHRRHYAADAVQIFAAGPGDVGDLADACSKGLSVWPEASTTPPISPARAAPGRQSARLAVPRPRTVLAFADATPLVGLELLRRELSLEMTLDILFGPRSEFFTRHYESGLLDGETFGGEVHVDQGYGFCVLGGDTDRPADLRNVVLDALHEARTSDWIENDFESARRRAYGDMVCRWEDVDGTVGFLESAGLRGCHPFEVTGLYSGSAAIDTSDIRRCLELCLRPEAVAVASIDG